MYRVAVRNDEGELLGTDYVYDDEEHGGDLYDDDGGWDDGVEVDCCGHVTAEQTSGDASQQADGSWVCDLGPCPGPAAQA